MVSYRVSLSHNHGMWLGFLQGLQFDVKIGGKIGHVLYGGVTLSN
jgi:cell shape-determining protein MreD